MKIQVLQTFLDDRTRYEAGTEHDVDATAAAFFIANGWAAGPDGYKGPGTNQNVTLAIDDGLAGHKATKLGKGK